MAVTMSIEEKEQWQGFKNQLIEKLLNLPEAEPIRRKMLKRFADEVFNEASKKIDVLEKGIDEAIKICINRGQGSVTKEDVKNTLFKLLMKAGQKKLEVPIDIQKKATSDRKADLIEAVNALTSLVEKD